MENEEGKAVHQRDDVMQQKNDEPTWTERWMEGDYLLLILEKTNSGIKPLCANLMVFGGQHRSAEWTLGKGGKDEPSSNNWWQASSLWVVIVLPDVYERASRDVPPKQAG